MKANFSLAEQAFAYMARVARSGIWISSHVAALQSVSLCRCWSDVLDYLQARVAFLHAACDACGLPLGRTVAKWQFRSIAQTAGVCGSRRFLGCVHGNLRGERAQHKLFLTHNELSPVEVWLCVLVDGDAVTPVDVALDPETVQTWADVFNSVPYSGGGAHVVRATVELAGIAQAAGKAVC